MLVHFFYVMSGFDEKNLNSKTHLEKSLENLFGKIKRKSFSLWRLTGRAHPSGPSPSSNRPPDFLSLSQLENRQAAPRSPRILSSTPRPDK